MRSITIGDVRQQFASLVEECTDLGLIDPTTERLVLSEGSKYCGNAYRVNLTGVYDPETETWTERGSGLHSPPFGRDYLGMTKAEAYEGLQAARRGARRMAEDRRLHRHADTVGMIVDTLEADEDWSADTLDLIAEVLIARGHAKADDGMSKAVK